MNLPMKQYGCTVQDDWRLSDRLTMNLGLRYDVVTGLPIDQRMVTNFQCCRPPDRPGALLASGVR